MHKFSNDGFECINENHIIQLQGKDDVKVE
jgi:hypothetical protein